MPATHVVRGNYVSRLVPPAFDLFMGQSEQTVPIPVRTGVCVSFRDDQGWTALALQWKQELPADMPQPQLQAIISEAAQFWVMNRMPASAAPCHSVRPPGL